MTTDAPEQTSDGVSFGDVLGAARRQIWLVLGVMAIAMLVAFAVTTLQSQVYEGKMSIVAGTNGTSGTQTGPELASTGVTQTLSSLIRSDIVSANVVRSLGLTQQPNELAKKLTVTVKPESAVLDVSLKWKDRDQVVPILNKIGAVFMARVNRDLQANERSGTPITFVRIFSPANVQAIPISPKPARTVAIAAMLGLLLGLLLAVLREHSDQPIRNYRDAESDFGAPVIGVVPRRSGPSRTEALTMLRINVGYYLRQSVDRSATPATLLLTYPLNTSAPSEKITAVLTVALEAEVDAEPNGNASRQIGRRRTIRRSDPLDVALSGGARSADLLVIVARKGRTSRSAARATRVFVERLGVTAVAVVLTDSSETVVPVFESQASETQLRPASATSLTGR